jgi:DDE superfamily endonuclease
MGLGQTEQFQRYHRVLNRATWSGREVSHVLLGLLVKTFVPSNSPLVIGVDETLERRWGKKIAAKGVYRYLRYAPPTSASSKRAASDGCA